MSVRYILASASPRRREILTQVGISFEVMASDVEEIITETVPEKMVMELATLKSNDIRDRILVDIKEKPDSDLIENDADMHERIEYDRIYVIGADTMVFCDGLHMGKPHDEEDAFRMLDMLQGNTHQVITGVCVNELISGTQTVFAETTDVSVVRMNEEQIRDYIKTGECLDKAGSYAIQGYFSRYINRIEGDYYNVVGFPICSFCEKIIS